MPADIATDLTVQISGKLPLDLVVQEVSKALADGLRGELKAAIAQELKTWVADGLRNVDLAPVVRDAAREVVDKRLPNTNFGGLGFNQFLAQALQEFVLQKLNSKGI